MNHRVANRVMMESLHTDNRETKKAEFQWKGKMQHANIVKAVETITMTGKDQVDPNHMKFVKRGCK